MDYLDQWNEEQRRAAAEWSRRHTSLQRALAQLVVHVGSRNGELGVTVDAHGNITDLRITSQALRGGETQLRRILLETIQRAQVEAQHQAEATMRPYIDDPAAAAAMSFIREALGDNSRIERHS